MPQNLTNPFAFCILCGMQSRGFVVQFNPTVHCKPIKIATRSEPYPLFHCCSLKCADAALKIIIALRGEMSANTITAMEQQAIKDARQQLWDASLAIGAAELIKAQPEQNVDYLIYTIWCGLRASMQRQSAAGEIPF